MIRCQIGLVFLLALFASGCQTVPLAHSSAAQPTALQPSISVQPCFTPPRGCTQLITDTIAQAHSEILVQAYSFTSEPIAQALVAAHQRGVKVEAILDKSQKTEDDSRAKLLFDAGIPVQIDSAHAIAHNKVMVIDGAVVIAGSFNFTKSAEERNAENLLVITDKALAEKYEENWRKHDMHAQPYVP
jgi:phosphatidylserine/phosphatidylglycerophosphate/cardiolipin synthase-like enzyme